MNPMVYFLQYLIYILFAKFMVKVELQNRGGLINPDGGSTLVLAFSSNVITDLSSSGVSGNATTTSY